MIVQSLLFGVIVLLLKCANAEYNVAKYCQLVQPGVKLPSWNSCQTYYKCFDTGMYVQSTCPDDQVYDKDAQNCVAQSEGNCYFGVSNPCRNKDRTFAYCSNGCNWYNYCINGQIAGNGTCPTGERFNPTTGICINGNCNDNNDIARSDVVDVCDIMPDGIYFGDFENCQAWHKCSAFHEEHGVCENSLVYDVTLGSCLENDGTMCERSHNVVGNRHSGPPPQQECTSTNQIVADTNVCSSYYKCQLGNQSPSATSEWVKFDCQNQFYDVISKQCRDHAVARVYPGCNRCEFTSFYTSNYWTNDVDPYCQKYLTCKNGNKEVTSTRSCEPGYYFDEPSQSCIESDEMAEEYELYNGACQNYECDDSRECAMSS